MGIKRDIPQIFALRKCVEARFGKPFLVHSDFLALVEQIEKEQHQHISESTLERVWGYSTRGYDTVSLRTLDVLAQYGSGCIWSVFCDNLNIACESEFFNQDMIAAKDLAIGQIIRFGWHPDRICEVEYLGNNRFITIRCEHSKIQVGDTFSCMHFLLGKELILHDFCQSSSESCQTYIVGKIHGLTVLTIIEEDRHRSHED